MLHLNLFLDPVIVLPNSQKDAVAAVWDCFMNALSRIVSCVQDSLPLQIGIFAIIALGAVDIVLTLQNRGDGE